MVESHKTALHVGQEEGLSVRYTLRLPSDLLEWLKRQGGSEYVRELLSRHKAARWGAGARGLRSAWSLREEWEQLTQEREFLKDDRALLEDEERVLDHRRSQLDKEWALLEESREQLEDDWGELEQVRMELETQAEMLIGLFSPMLVPLKVLMGGRYV